jgi:hypothetical protein
MRRKVKNRLFCLVVGTAYANCPSTDFRTIAGAPTIYNVGNMVSDISLTTNDVAVGLLVQKPTDTKLQESSIYYI